MTCCPGVELVEGGRYHRTAQHRRQVGRHLRDRLDRRQASPRGRSSRPRWCRRSCRCSPASAGCSISTPSRRWWTRSSRTAGSAPGSRGGPGLRIPGAFDGIEAVLRALSGWSRRASRRASRRGAWCEAWESRSRCGGARTCGWLAPDAARVAEAGRAALAGLGLARRTAETLGRIAAGAGGATPVARAGERRGRGAPRADRDRRRGRAARHPDRGPRAALAGCVRPRRPPAAARRRRWRRRAAFGVRAERWRPWRGYAALHLLLGLPPQARRTADRAEARSAPASPSPACAGSRSRSRAWRRGCPTARPASASAASSWRGCGRTERCWW